MGVSPMDFLKENTGETPVLQGFSKASMTKFETNASQITIVADSKVFVSVIRISSLEFHSTASNFVLRILTPKPP
jgi:hypothetical protein